MLKTSSLQVVVNCWGENQGQYHRTEKAPDHRNSEGLKHLRTCADGKSQRQHARDCGKRCHRDGAESSSPGLNHRVLKRGA